MRRGARRGGPRRRGRPCPGRLLGRRPGPAGDLPRDRHRASPASPGSGLLQPGDGAAAVPAAHVARRVGPGRAAAVGLAIFAGACLACAASSELRTLIAARCVQALGGALRSPRCWSCCRHRWDPNGGRSRSGRSPGATGAALGPAVGGILTELVSWQSIFLLQVPIALLAGIPILAVARHEAATGVSNPSSARPAARMCSPTSPWR